MSTYNILARRHIGEDWTAWTNTDDYNTAFRNIKTIEKLGWSWTMEYPMIAKQFKRVCSGRGIAPELVNKYCKGRIKFVTEDVEILESGRWNI